MCDRERSAVAWRRQLLARTAEQRQKAGSHTPEGLAMWHKQWPDNGNVFAEMCTTHRPASAASSRSRSGRNDRSSRPPHRETGLGSVRVALPVSFPQDSDSANRPSRAGVTSAIRFSATYTRQSVNSRRQCRAQGCDAMGMGSRDITCNDRSDRRAPPQRFSVVSACHSCQEQRCVHHLYPQMSSLSMKKERCCPRRVSRRDGYPGNDVSLQRHLPESVLRRLRPHIRGL